MNTFDSIYFLRERVNIYEHTYEHMEEGLERDVPQTANSFQGNFHFSILQVGYYLNSLQREYSPILPVMEKKFKR